MLVQDVPVETRVAPTDLYARMERARGAPWRGIIAAGAPFEVFGHVTGGGCTDWGLVAAGAYACLDGTSVSEDAPALLPRELYDGLPFLYGNRAPAGSGPVYASITAWERGDAPLRHLRPEHTYAFVGVATTTRGEVNVRSDGTVVPRDSVRPYAGSTFGGRDLLIDPVPEGATLGWCVTQKGCARGEGEPPLAFHEGFIVTGSMPGGLTRAWRPSPRPEGVAADELWVDVDLQQETLALVRGDTPEFVTLVSTGVGGRYPTPRGTRRVLDKQVHNDMASLPDSPDPYLVERVPWVVHFRPRFALHGTFWHDRFGLRASHGCVNLSPADARRVFDAVTPSLPAGWKAIYTLGGSGTVIRIR